MALVTDEVANKKSLMLLQKSICGGKEEGGFQCKYYWNFIKKVDSNNAYQLKSGETVRWCILCPSYPIEWEGENDMPVQCNKYDPDTDRPYSAKLEEYEPLSPEEVKKILGEESVEKSQIPNPNDISNPENWTSNMAESPNHNSDNKNSEDSISADDVMNAIDNETEKNNKDATCSGIFNGEEEND